MISETAQTATVDAPIEAVDIADWVLNLPDAEYRRCAPGEHIAAGRTTTDDGRPMSINVENIGGTLVIQHYVAEVHEAHHCHLVSLSDAQTEQGWIKVQATWDMRVEPNDDGTCRLTNTVTTHATQGFLPMKAYLRDTAANGELPLYQPGGYAAALLRGTTATGDKEEVTA
ncbi:hypothetical protein ACFYR1_06285 [Streptomyces canus]|uniref:hypothetical protein n=1 Tax=Streptomyces canus TaxID=58343 RepID=UPI0036BA6807